MALSVDYIYQFALRLIKKNQAGGLASTEFAYHWNDAQGSYQDDLLGRFQARNNGKEGANTGLIQDATIMTKLAPFITPYTLTINGSNQATKPTDFVYTLSLRINDVDVYQVDHDQIANMLDDAIDPPSIPDDAYYYTEFLNFYQFSPAGLTTCQLDYIATPIDIFWNYGFDVNNRQVYTSVGSVQPQWDNNSCREITKRMLTNLGVSFKDSDFEQFGKSVQLTGE